MTQVGKESLISSPVMFQACRQLCWKVHQSVEWSPLSSEAGMVYEDEQDWVKHRGGHVLSTTCDSWISLLTLSQPLATIVLYRE